MLRGLHDAIEPSALDGFCTALYLTVRPGLGGAHLQLSAGGHHLPLRVDDDGDIEEVGRTGHLLGMLGPPRLHDVDVRLGPSESLVLFTDGVLGGRRGTEYFGTERLRQVLAARNDRPAQEVADAVATAAVDFQAGNTRDDIAVVVLTVPAA